MRNPWGHRPEDPPEGEDPGRPINGDPPGQPWYHWRGGDMVNPLIGLVVFLIVLVILLKILGVVT